MTEHRTIDELAAGVVEVRRSPRDSGSVELVVSRPALSEREVLGEGLLDPVTGLVGDTWPTRPSRETADGSANRNRQLTLMNSRAAALFAGEVEQWPLAGDQLYVDFDISETSLPPGSRVEVGSAVIEISAEPHTGCAKFSQRFGVEALRFVNSAEGRELRLRGVNAKVVDGGTVRPGDVIRRQ